MSSNPLKKKKNKKLKIVGGMRKQWCDRCKSSHEMPRCEFIALPKSEGGHIPDWMYDYEEPCEHRKHISSGGKCAACAGI